MASLLVRIIWFLAVGWWLAIVWVSFALLACVTILGLPVGLWMFSKTWKIASLEENPVDIAKGVSQQVTIVTNNQSSSEKKESPLAALKRKYADGEITKEEYRERVSVLTGSDDSGSAIKRNKKERKKTTEDEE